MSADPAPSHVLWRDATSAPPPGDADYEAICAAVMETERGRWFMGEFGRRNRHADTVQVLAAIERLEAMARRDSAVVAAPSTARPAGETADANIERLRGELAAMANAIARTKVEIASIKPDAEPSGRIMEATEQLDSVLKTTERATSDILAAAEQVQEVAWTMREQGMESEFCDRLDRYATEIYTACSFQDLTGQRTRKIIHVMRYLEARIEAMTDIWAPQATAAVANSGHYAPTAGLVQNEIDNVMMPPRPTPSRAMAVAAEPPAAAPRAEAPRAVVPPVVAAPAVAPPIVAVPVVPALRQASAAEPATPVAAIAAKPPSLVTEGPPGSFSIRGARDTPPVAPPAPHESGSIEADIVAFASDLIAEYAAKPTIARARSESLQPSRSQSVTRDLDETPLDGAGLLSRSLHGDGSNGVGANGPNGTSVTSRLEGTAVRFAPSETWAADAAPAAAMSISGIPVAAVSAPAKSGGAGRPEAKPDPRELLLPLAASPRFADLAAAPATMTKAGATTRKTDISADLFADVMALSEEERIALFT